MQAASVRVRSDERLETVERILVEQRLTGLPVVDDGRLVGVISRSDVARVHVLADALDGQIAEELHWDETQADGFKHDDGEKFLGFKQRLEKLRVKDVMRSQVVTCPRDTPIAEVAALLVRHHIHRVFVVDGDKPLGVINSLDLVGLLATV
jgi:CBS domain-containing protein